MRDTVHGQIDSGFKAHYSALLQQDSQHVRSTQSHAKTLQLGLAAESSSQMHGMLDWPFIVDRLTYHKCCTIWSPL